MMMGNAGMGDDSTTAPATTTTAPTPGFTDGLTVWWTSPSTAVSDIGGALQNTGTAFSGSQLGYSLGLIVLPLAALAILFGGKGR